MPNGAQNPPASRAGLTDGDTYLLAQLINAEAKGEPFEGQVAVGAVVLNRVFDPDFPKTIRDVIFQYDGDTDTYQFEPVENGAINDQPCSSAIRAAQAALSGWDPTGGALYFYNPREGREFLFRERTDLSQADRQACFLQVGVTLHVLFYFADDAFDVVEMITGRSRSSHLISLAMASRP